MWADFPSMADHNPHHCWSRKSLCLSFWEDRCGGNGALSPAAPRSCISGIPGSNIKKIMHRCSVLANAQLALLVVRCANSNRKMIFSFENSDYLQRKYMLHGCSVCLSRKFRLKAESQEKPLHPHWILSWEFVFRQFCCPWGFWNKESDLPGSGPRSVHIFFLWFHVERMGCWEVDSQRDPGF